LSWNGTIHLDLDLTSELSSYLQIRLEDAELDRLIAQASWYDRPLRLQGSCEFKGGDFYKAKGEFRYWEDPWSVKLTGELPEGESPTTVLQGNYDDDTLEAEFELSWEEMAFSELEAYLDLPAVLDWRTRWTLDLEAEQTPSLGGRAYGPVPWGELTFYWEDLTLSQIRFQWEGEKGGWQHELYLDWVIGEDPELDVDSVFYLDEQTGYGLSVKATGLSSLVLKKLSPFVFGTGWKLALDLVDQEISLRASREFEDAELGCDLVWGEDGLEGELWLDFFLGDVELTEGLSWEEGILDELSLELYLEF